MKHTTKTVKLDIIRKRRREMKLSSKDMAKKLGIHIRTYYRQENGELSLSELQDIMAILDLKLIIATNEQIM